MNLHESADSCGREGDGLYLQVCRFMQIHADSCFITLILYKVSSPFIVNCLVIKMLYSINTVSSDKSSLASLPAGPGRVPDTTTCSREKDATDALSS